MYIVRNIKTPINSDFSDLTSLFSKLTKIPIQTIDCVILHKKSVDARNKQDIFFNCTFLVKLNNKNSLKYLKKFKPEKFTEQKYNYTSVESEIKPIIVGFGPAGMFSAIVLARCGLKPIVIEKGKCVEQRLKDVEDFFSGKPLIENSNIQFGEGGAGTFSDGKLNTGINDFRIREVLATFVQHGAPENILFDSKPHIGTDILVKVVKSIRNEILSLGGQIFFECEFIDFSYENGQLTKITISKDGRNETIKCNYLILAPGHSSRKTFKLLKEKNLHMTPKAFAVGVRIEHKQKDINFSQYGDFADSPYLDAADYKLSCHLDNKRGIFSFCMCPGGYVVNSSSEKNGCVTNGMSMNARDGENSNSAILVSINVEDYYKNDVLDGMYFQQEIEKKAYEIGRGYPVSQKYGDFKKGIVSKEFKKIIPTIRPKYHTGDINKIFPEFINSSLINGIDSFERKIKGFSDYDAVLTAPETRSSSPIRIIRDETGNSSIEGIYPCGEGAGYAGGITSAAVDGIKIAELIIEKIKNKKASN